MASTYEPIATISLSGLSNYAFTAIPGTYTDLRLVIVEQTSTGVSETLTFNSDTATNYSYTQLYGDGTNALSTRATNANALNAGSGVSSPNFALAIYDIFSYAGSTYKSALITTSQDTNGSGTVRRRTGLWRSTAAITRIDLTLSSGTYSAGSTATLYGIKAA